MSIYHTLHRRWYDKAKKRALRDPRYAEIEKELLTRRGTYLWTGKEDLWRERGDIFDRINREPIYLRIAAFFEHSSLTPRHLRRRVQFFVQRGRRGWSDGDAWSLDHYLNGVVIGSVTRLRSENHHHPAELSQALWAAVLTAIIDGFEAANRILELPPADERATAQAAFDLGFELLHEYWFSLWD